MSAEAITLLEAKRDEVIRRVRTQERPRLERIADPMDNDLAKIERDHCAANLERDFRLLEDIEAAIARARRNEYGICVDCDEEIPAKRLQAVPWASRCVADQDRYDRRLQDPHAQLEYSDGQ